MDKPAVGFGTLGLANAEASVRLALDAGCGLVDTAEHYGNLEAVGAALQASGAKPYLVVKLSGLPSGDLGAVRERLLALLGQLGVARADLCLMHWPGLCSWDATDMSPLASPAAFQGKASPWAEFVEHVAAAWTNLVRLKEEGLCGEIGTSNFYAMHLDELAKQSGGAVPYANEIFVDITNQETEFVADMQKRNIRVLAYRPVAYRPFPAEVQSVAARLGGGASQPAVVLAWLLRRGIWPLVKSDDPAHCKENLSMPQLLVERLSADDFEELGKCDAGMKNSQEWFAKLWKCHGSAAPAFSQDDVDALVAMGVDEEKARAALEANGGDVNAALDAVFAEG